MTTSSNFNLSTSTFNRIRSLYGDSFTSQDGTSVAICSPPSFDHAGTLIATLQHRREISRSRSGRPFYTQNAIGAIRIDREGNLLEFGRYNGQSLRPATTV